MFLTLVGLTALGVGGVGAGQAVRAFLDRKRAEIAIFKIAGRRRRVDLPDLLPPGDGDRGAAPLLLGAALGAALPFGRLVSTATTFRCRAHFGIYPAPLLLAPAFGLLSAVAFAVPPLAAPAPIPPASLFRDTGRAGQRPRRAALSRRCRRRAALCIVGLTLLLAPSPLFAAEFLGGALAASGAAAPDGGRPAPRDCAACRGRASPLVRLAFANLTRPGAATGGVVTALGLGLTLLATVTLLDAPSGAGGRRPARPRAQLLLRRHPAGRGRRLRPHHHRFSSASGLPAHAR